MKNPVLSLSEATAPPRAPNNGEEVPKWVHPYSVSLYYEGKFLCSGTLVGKRPPTLITAGHCLHGDLDPTKLSVLYFDKNNKEKGIKLTGKSIFIEPNFKESEDIWDGFYKFLEEKGLSNEEMDGSTREKFLNEFLKTKGKNPDEFRKLQNSSKFHDAGVLILDGDLPNTIDLPKVSTKKIDGFGFFGIVGMGGLPKQNPLSEFLGINSGHDKKRTGIVALQSSSQSTSDPTLSWVGRYDRGKKGLRWLQPSTSNGDSGGSIFSIHRISKAAPLLQGIISYSLGADPETNQKLQGGVDIGTPEVQKFLQEAKSKGADLYFLPPE